MKMIKLFITAVVLLFSVTSANAFVLDVGSFKFTGDAYVDPTGAVTDGIGRITTITQGANIIYSWGDGGQYLDFAFQGVLPVLSPASPFYNYIGTSGTLDLFMNTSSSILNLTESTSAAINDIVSNGSLYLSTAFNGDIYGQAAPSYYTASGFADVTGGSAAALYNTNSVLNTATNSTSTYSDITFGLVGHKNQVGSGVGTQYTYISSVDASGAITTVPEPASIFLFGVGIMIIGVVSKSKMSGYTTA